MIYPKLYCCESRTVLKCRLLFELSGVEKADAFFKSILNSVLCFLDDTLYPKICEEYKNCEDKNKRFSFGYFYNFELTPVFCDNEYLSFRIKTDLKNKDRSYVRSYGRYFVSRNSDGSILPYEYFTGKGFRKKYRKEGYENYCLKDMELLFFDPNGAEYRFSLI